MQLNIRDGENYKGTLAKLSVLTVAFSILCTFFGYLLMPLAAATYALLLTFENRGRRVFSFLIPIVTYLINLLFMGFYSLEGIAYAIVGVIIFLLVKRGKTKGEIAFWISFATVVMMFISALLLAMAYNESASITKAFLLYKELIVFLETKFVDILVSLKDETGLAFAFTREDAIMLYNELILSIVPIVMVVAFIISGFTLKFFTRLAFRYSEKNPALLTFSFKTTNFIAYFYLIVVILSFIVPADGSTFYYLLTSLYSVFSVVYLYLGVKFLFAFFIARGKSPIITVLIIIAIFVVFSSFVVCALSLLGVYVNNSMNKILSKFDKK